MIVNKLYKKLFTPRIWERIYRERFCEPFLYNFVSLFVFLFCSYRKKIYYDLVPRQPYAYGIDLACTIAKRERIQKVVLIEFGVAAGAGLFNMIDIARNLTKETGVEFTIVGFDTGAGMPPPIDFRDHPEKYREGDFPMDKDQLVKSLPSNAKIYFGDLKDALKKFFNEMSLDYKIGFISVDLDYYSSTKDSLIVLLKDAHRYLHMVPMYFDDVNNIEHNEYCGELLAIKEFNHGANNFRKIIRINQLRDWRLLKYAIWLDQMYFAHIFDHEYRSIRTHDKSAVVTLDNPYL